MSMDRINLYGMYGNVYSFDHFIDYGKDHVYGIRWKN